MKNYIFAALLFPLFAGAQDSLTLEQAHESILTPSGVAKNITYRYPMEMYRWRSVRCGRHSDWKCLNRRAYDSCEKDNSHGYYGKCYNIAQRGPEVVCSCR